MASSNRTEWDFSTRGHVLWDRLERYHLGIITDEPELARIEEHILSCPQCAERAEEAADYVDAMRAAACELAETLLPRTVEFNLRRFRPRDGPDSNERDGVGRAVRVSSDLAPRFAVTSPDLPVVGLVALRAKSALVLACRSMFLRLLSWRRG